MRIEYFTVGLLALFSPLAAAWSKEDREIFRVRDEISAHESDPDATFYDILGIAPSASHDDITKAYRKKTRLLHPDKVKQQLQAERTKKAKKDKNASSKGPSQAEIKTAVKQASERQTRLTLIATVLRGPGRDRYDHFLANGFPLWKGTDYYYNRYRPGLGTVMFGLFLVGGGAIHYLILYMSWKRQKEFVERYIKFARDTAWGGLGIPGMDSATPTPAPPAPSAQDDEDGPPQPMNRRQRRMQEKEAKREGGRSAVKKLRKTESSSNSREASAGPAGARKRVVAENGKILVVDSVGDVFLEEEDEEGNVNEFLLDPNELPAPAIKDTAVIRLPLWFFNASIGRLIPGKAGRGADAAQNADDADSDAPQHTPSSDSAGEDFEMLDKSVDSLGKAKASGNQQQGGKANKRRGRKR